MLYDDLLIVTLHPTIVHLFTNIAMLVLWIFLIDYNYMKPTLRALGIEYIQQFVSDKPTFIAGAIKEHEETLLDPTASSESLIIAPQSLENRIIDLFGDSRIYGLIAWFLEQEGLEFTNEQALKNRVRHEYESARTLQFYEDKRLTPCYHNLVAQGNGRLLHMSDIVEALKDSGY